MDSVSLYELVDVPAPVLNASADFDKGQVVSACPTPFPKSRHSNAENRRRLLLRALARFEGLQRIECRHLRQFLYRRRFAGFCDSFSIWSAA
jgi:hypothetical protein